MLSSSYIHRSCFSVGYDSFKRAKLVAIHKALQSDPVDVAALRKFAISKGGLLTDDIRRKAWPKLLNISPFDTVAKGTVRREIN